MYVAPMQLAFKEVASRIQGDGMEDSTIVHLAPNSSTDPWSYAVTFDVGEYKHKVTDLKVYINDKRVKATFDNEKGVVHMKFAWWEKIYYRIRSLFGYVESFSAFYQVEVYTTGEQNEEVDTVS